MDSTLVRFPNTSLTNKLITAIVKFIYVSSEVSASTVVIKNGFTRALSLVGLQSKAKIEFERKVYGDAEQAPHVEILYTV